MRHRTVVVRALSLPSELDRALVRRAQLEDRAISHVAAEALDHWLALTATDQRPQMSERGEAGNGQIKSAV